MNGHDVATARHILAEGQAGTPWIDVKEAAKRARCGVKLLYREIRAGRLQAARVGGRRELRLRAEWIDVWLTAQATGESPNSPRR